MAVWLLLGRDITVLHQLGHFVVRTKNKTKTTASDWPACSSAASAAPVACEFVELAGFFFGFRPPSFHLREQRGQEKEKNNVDFLLSDDFFVVFFFWFGVDFDVSLVSIRPEFVP